MTSAENNDIDSNFSALRTYSRQWINITASFNDLFQYLQGQFQRYVTDVKIEIGEKIIICYLTKRISIQVNPITKNAELYGVISVQLENGGDFIDLDKYYLNRLGMLQDSEANDLFEVEFGGGKVILWLQGILASAMEKETRQSM